MPPLTSEGWEKLFQLAGSEPVSYAKDAVIMQDGEAHEFVYRLQQGSVRVEKGDPRFSASRTAVVNILSPGVTFGEMSFLDGAPACATCVADSDDVSVVRLSRAALEGVLEAEANLGRDFFCQMAIEVTHRLQKVSTAIAETGEAPRGLTQPADAALPISAKKLLKVRHRLGVPDTETMAFMCAATMVNPSKRRLHGTMYVFETLVGFVHKMFGIKQQESVPYRHVSEVLRETFTLKREDGGIELVLSVPNRSYLFYPAAVDDAFDAIHRCRDQFVAKQSRQAPAPVPSPRFEQDPHSEAAQALGEESSAVFLKEATTLSSGSSRSERSTPRAALRADSFGGLALAKVVSTATLERYRPGDVIIAEGSQPATLFNLARGRVSVEVPRLDAVTGLTQSAKILTLYEGAMFGEMSFLSGGKACATVVAEVESEVWQIRAPAVESSLASLPLNEQAVFYKHLGGYLSARVRQLTAMVGENYAARSGEVSLEEVLSNAVFFSLFTRWLASSGMANKTVLHFLTDIKEFLATPANDSLRRAARDVHAKYFATAERAAALGVSESAAADIRSLVASDTLPPRDLFGTAITEVLSKLQAHAYRSFMQSAAFQPLLDLKAKEKYVPCVTDFKLLQILGEGYEGKVLHARKKDCGVMYALKVLDKQILASRSRRWQLHASRELECLKACDHPYVVPVHYSFQTPQFLYMVQEHVPNHTLARYLEKHEGKPMREEEVRFMAGQLVCALAHMHKQTIVYRDLKPANVLIDTEGHLRMVDMGMASKLDPETGRRKSVCGTQRYMAPEMKAKQPYEQSVDWFSLGKLILDCHGRDPYAKECAYWETSGLLELIDALLVKEPTKRRGYGRDGARDIQRSAFFGDLDWAALDAKKLPSPLQRHMYERAPDVSMTRQFRNGEDINKVVEKLQHISLDTGRTANVDESGPGNIPSWDHISPSVVYSEYLQSPFHSARSYI